MKNTLLQIFTWWSGQTIGTRFHTWRHGELIGEDSEGNRYYQTRGGVKDPAIGVVRRWMTFIGPVEATRVPPGRHAWLRHTAETPPTQDGYQSREWEIEHKANLTGTPFAYRPKGPFSPAANARAPRATTSLEPGN